MTYDPGRTLLDIRQMPYGTARIAAAEAVTRRIEADGPRERLAEALLDLVEAYTFANEGAKSFVAFARLLRLWDTTPELFDAADERNLFWEFKWVAGDLGDFAEITIEQGEAFLADMRRRFDLAGKGPSSVAMSEFRWAWHAGLSTMEQARLTWLTTPRDDFDDCVSCTIGQQVDYFTENARFDEAVQLGRQQTETCNLEPTRTLHALALALLHVGEPVESAATYRRALATLDTSDSDFAPARGQGFELLARGGQLERALRALREDYPQLLVAASTEMFRMRFLISVLGGLSANLDAADTPTGLRNIDAPTLGQLHEWVHREVVALGERFDRRGRTDYYARLIAVALSAKKSAVTLDLDVRAAVPASVQEGAAVTVADADVSSFAQAEALAAAGDDIAASACYADAAEAAQAAGLLEQAGIAWAESARCAQTAGDDATAHERYAWAVPRLRAAGADDALVARVLVAWAPTAARLDDVDRVLELVEAGIARAVDSDTSDLSEQLAAARAAHVAGARSDLLDVFARLIASTAPQDRREGRDAASAVRAAITAGETYAQHGRIPDAAHAFWLAGRIQRETGDTEGALWSLESAVEGFTIAKDRSARYEAAGEFIELLRATGQSARADDLVASLTR